MEEDSREVGEDWIKGGDWLFSDEGGEENCVPILLTSMEWLGFWLFDFVSSSQVQDNP